MSNTESTRAQLLSESMKENKNGKESLQLSFWQNKFTACQPIIHLSGNAYNRMKMTRTQENVYISTYQLIGGFSSKNEVEHCQHHAHKQHTKKNPQSVSLRINIGYLQTGQST